MEQREWWELTEDDLRKIMICADYDEAGLADMFLHGAKKVFKRLADAVIFDVAHGYFILEKDVEDMIMWSGDEKKTVEEIAKEITGKSRKLTCISLYK